LVGKEDLPNAVALNSIQFNVARIAGPALGGFAIAVIGVAGCFYLNALSFVAVIGALLIMHQSEFHDVPPRLVGKVLPQLAEGVRYAVSTPDIALVLIVLLVVGTAGYNFTVMLPLVAKYSLHSGPGGFGLLTSAMGVGSVVSGVGVAYARSPSRKRLFIGASGFSVFLFLLSFANNWWYAIPVVVGVGVFSIIFSTTANTRLQLLAPPAMRGRIMSIYQLLFAGTTPIGGSGYGFLADTGGVGWATGVVALICGGGVLAGLAYLRLGSLHGPKEPPISREPEVRPVEVAVEG
jgi:MFS family permease